MARLLKFVLCLCLLVCVTGVTRAETIYLKNGNKLTGKILEETPERIKLEVDVEGAGKAVMTILKSRIERIETATTFEEHLKAGEALIVAENYREAEARFRELVRSEPRNARARMGLAKSLVGLFRYEEAVKTLEHYLILVERNRDAALMLFLADQYLEARDYRNARRTAQEAGALYPTDTSLQVTVDEFLKRIERVRNGTEQLKERETAATAERRRLREERAEWDAEQGNNADAAKTARELTAWTAESHSRLVLSFNVQAEVAREEMTRFLNGDDETRLQGAVTKIEVKIIVDQVRWLEMYDHQKSVLLYGWYYQLKGRYPRSWPVVTVYCTEEVRGKPTEKRLARASWDGRRDQVVIDRWTKENRDPSRPVRRIVR